MPGGYHGEPLSTRQKKFANEYLRNGGNATQAAIKAGYSKKSARSQGHNMLQRLNVQDYIAKRQKMLSRTAQVDAERVIKELASIGFANLGDAVEWDSTGVRLKASKELAPELTAAIAGVEDTRFGVRIKVHDKNVALQTLARALGMLKDNVNVKTDVLERIRQAMEEDDDKQ